MEFAGRLYHDGKSLGDVEGEVDINRPDDWSGWFYAPGNLVRQPGQNMDIHFADGRVGKIITTGMEQHDGRICLVFVGAERIHERAD
jgi:hypothetical protein